MKLYQALKKVDGSNVLYMYIDGINTKEYYIFDRLLSDVYLKDIINILNREVVEFNIEGICIDITIMD